jgi:hypothetical protein
MYKTAVGVGWLQTALLQKRLPCIVNLVRCRFPLSLALYLALYLAPSLVIHLKSFFRFAASCPLLAVARFTCNLLA